MTGRAARRWAVTGVGLGAFCVQLDSFALNLALPRIGRDLGASGGHLGWVVSAYLLACGTLMLGAGRLGDRIGHRRLLAWSLISFALASVLCALAPRLALLVAARAVQGAVGAPIMPAGLALLTNTFPPGPRQRAIGLALGIGGIGTACGPLVGGALVQALSWQAVFWLNVPCALLAAWCLTRARESRSTSSGSTDLPGLAAAGVLVASLALLSDRIPIWGRHSVRVAAALGVALAVLVAVERRTAEPLVRPALLRDGRFMALTAAGAVANAATVVVLLVVPWALQDTWGLDPLPAAVAFLAPAAALAAAGPAAGRVGATAAVTAATLCLLGAAALLYATGTAATLVGYLSAAAGSAALLGIANALAMTATQELVRPEIAGEAAGLTKTVLTLAAGLGVLLIGPSGGPGGRLTRPAAEHALTAAAIACLAAALLLACRVWRRRRSSPTTH
ncbi:MFS transporter [Kitasatospora sp. MAP5-34]|uniref:MFS transporter n=1 Tax=Kitasatospora sp. MAP5-34 TaxID=3035102 RepID=UPI002475F762|nr:MFS transporter [Kitasatospora sp. MAP5-34]MDH6575304.1 putative MFS family arabinose efflux permease [Kitasatospora sp. MAP5-34]